MQDKKTIQLLNLSTDELLEAISSDLIPRLESLIQEQKQQEPEEEYLTRKEVAEKLKITLPTVSSWSEKGILKSHRIATQIRFKKSEVDKALKEI